MTTRCDPNYVLYREPGGFLAFTIQLPADGPDDSRKVNPRTLIRSPAIKDLSPEHRRIIMQFIMHCPDHAIHNLLQGRNGFDLVKAIIATGRAHWLTAKGKTIQWGEPCKAELAWTTHKNDLYTTFLSLQDPADFLFPLTPPLGLFLATATLRPVAASVPDTVVGEWSAPRQPMDYQAGLEFCRALAARYPDAELPLPSTEQESTEEHTAPTPCLLISVRTFQEDNPAIESETVPTLKLTFDYGVARLHPADPRKTLVVTRGHTLLRCARDANAEAAAIARLRESGFRPLEEIVPHVAETARMRDWILSPEAPNDWATLQASIFPQLTAEGWSIEYATGCHITLVEDKDWYTDLETTEKGWFELEVGICVGRKKVSLLPVIHQLLARNRTRSFNEIRRSLAGRQVAVTIETHGVLLVSGDRLLVIIDHLVDLFDRPHQPGKKAGKRNVRITLDVWRAAEIGDIEKWSSSQWNKPEELSSLTQRLALANQLTPIPGPKALQTTLRTYQEWGLAWLQFMREAGFDGILADDMGLGKTIQTLAHLLIEKDAGRLHQPCLIVTPTSVIQNWADEAARFAPSLNFLVYHGSDRKEDHATLSDADVVLTSYPLLRQDIEYLQRQPFSLVILDEAHYIKNHRAQTAQAACALKSTRRLCLTGTPMENHLGELWALFNFLMPGFLGSAEAFQHRFRNPIEKDGQEFVRQSLSRRLAPFMLRRLKSQVEKELPPKTVIVHRVELSKVQREMYETVRLAMQARIREEIASRGLSRSHITVLDGLLKLRQVCCDPRLLKQGGAAHKGGPEHSAKLQALLDRVTELLEEGRRILLFSQFVGMLRLIEKELDALNIRYSLLTGETKDRATPIRQFQDGETALFLISLKAGGTGLNLTAADTVIHYDPWWNPAAENQATDRAHRIGQTKPIFAYRFLTVGTVEERIQSMQERKQKLADSILQEQQADNVSFTLNDVESLFAPIGAPSLGI